MSATTEHAPQTAEVSEHSDSADGGLPLLVRMHNATNETDRLQARDDVIAYYLPFATGLARRFQHRGVPADDLSQIAALALIKAVDRFEIGRGSKFTSFLAPTVLGEIKRYFRDHTWAMHTPRPLQERAIAISRASDELAQQLGRSPTVNDLAYALDVTEEEILEGMECGWSYRAVPISLPFSDDESQDSRDLPRGPDPGIEQTENWQSLRPLLRELPERDRRILRMRFVDDMSQAKIAEQIGLSQMQVSRLLTKCLLALRSRLLVDA